MRKTVYLFLIVTLLLVLSLSFVSASAPFNHRYQGDPHKSSASNYRSNYGGGYYDNSGTYRYNTVNQAQKPTFKGSYGNYRQVMYANGDYKPSLYFVNYPEYNYRPYFSGGSGLGYYGGYGIGSYYGGYGGYGGYAGYSGFGIGISRYSPSYSYNAYGLNYYPSYSYSYGGCSFGC